MTGNQCEHLRLCLSLAECDIAPIEMPLPTLDAGQRLLAALAVAVRARDSVLIRQVAEKADRELSDTALRRTFARLPDYGVTKDDLSWLEGCDL